MPGESLLKRRSKRLNLSPGFPKGEKEKGKKKRLQKYNNPGWDCVRFATS
jgi:hypothetical protein